MVHFKATTWCRRGGCWRGRAASADRSSYSRWVGREWELGTLAAMLDRRGWARVGGGRDRVLRASGKLGLPAKPCS